jgi:hypothetical protein
MHESQRLSISEFLAHPRETKEAGAVCHYTDTYDSRYEFSPNVPKPRDEHMMKFYDIRSRYSSTSTTVSSPDPLSGRYDINWLNPEDYLRNWEKLTKEERLSFRSIVMSDFVSNSNRYGLKTRNLEDHLLLHLGCDMKNILNCAKDPVKSNLRSPGYVDEYDVFHKGNFDSSCVKNRTVDPKTCTRAYHKFSKEFDVEKLFKSGFVCYQGVIRSDSSLRHMGADPLDYKKRVHDFFRSNTAFLSKLCVKKKRIFSYMYSNEVSVDSILHQAYRPHTHVIFFLQKTKKNNDQSLLVEDLEELFNNSFKDRELSVLRHFKDMDLVPKKVSNYKDIKNAVSYLFRAYSLAENYMREVRPSNIRELNLQTVKTYRNLIWLFKAEEANGLKGVRRFNSSYIPNKSEETFYSHPLLQKKKKSNTIS